MSADTAPDACASPGTDVLRLGFIGVGALTEAVIESLHRGHCQPHPILLSPRSENRSIALAAKYPQVKRMRSNAEVIEASDLIFLAMRPQQLAAAVAGLRFRPEQIVVSFLAATPLALIRLRITPAIRACRLSPTSAIAYALGPVVLYPGDALVERLFAGLGELIVVASESELDAVIQASALMSSHLQLQDAIVGWLLTRGVPTPIASRYIRSMFAGFAALTQAASIDSPTVNPGQFETRGGLNEHARRHLRGSGWFERIKEALDAIEAHSVHQAAPASQAPRVSSNDLERACRTIRRRIVASLYASGGGHYGGSLSVVEILAVLCRDFVFKGEASSASRDNGSGDNAYQTNVPRDDLARDKLILSKGHAAIALYATLAQLGRLDPSQLLRYGALGSGLEGHPDLLSTPYIDFSTGSLGQGLAVGAGMALALRGTGRHVWVVLGDGECQEGQVWEAAILTARHRLANLTAIVDANGAQDFGFAHNPHLTQSPLPDLAHVWTAFGWHAVEVDGHDVDSLQAAFEAASHRPLASKPSVIIAKTRKGAGVRMFESAPARFHCTRLTADQHSAVMKELR